MRSIIGIALGCFMLMFNVFSDSPSFSLTLRVADKKERWETMGYTYGMTSPSGLPLGIYVHENGPQKKRVMLYQGLLPLGEYSFQFEGDLGVNAAISMEASVIDPDPVTQCYVTQYLSGSLYTEGNCYADANRVIVLDSNLPFRVEHNRG